MTTDHSVQSADAAPAQRVNVLGVGVSAVNMDQAVQTIFGWVAARQRRYVCSTCVHGVMESQRDPELRRIHNAAGMVTPDGMPLLWLGHRAGHTGMTRVYAPDLMLQVCGRGIELGIRHYLYGGGPGVVDALASRLQQRLPGLIIAGRETPPFGDITAAPDLEAVSRINQASADVVWVGLGLPKQERWMALHRPYLEAPVLLGVGAAFDWHAGRKPQAPAWMQRAGLEWLFRLGVEPRRLWRRYLIYNPWFILLVALQSAGLRRYTLDP